jgi:NAD-dependent dihydropyrimidine dehydrogenase PreA subunit
MQDGVPVVAKAELCTGCSLCVSMCPEFAIKVTRNRDDASKSQGGR